MPSGTFYLSPVSSDGSGFTAWVATSGTLAAALKTSGTPNAQADSVAFGTDTPTDVLLSAAGPLLQISDDTPLTSLMNATATLNSGSILIRRQGTDNSGGAGDSGEIAAGQVRLFSGSYTDALTLRNKNDITLPAAAGNATLTFGSTDFDNWDPSGIVALLRSGKFGLAAQTTVIDTGFLCSVLQVQFTLDWTNGPAGYGRGRSRSRSRGR